MQNRTKSAHNATTPCQSRWDDESISGLCGSTVERLGAYAVLRDRTGPPAVIRVYDANHATNDRERLNDAADELDEADGGACGKHVAVGGEVDETSPLHGAD